MEHFLLKLFIFLTAAVIAVPLAKKFKLGSVLGYLIAGIIIGPFGFSMIDKVEKVMHFTEFGVVMMLFLVGLELKPSLLWKMKTPILGMGGSQVIFSAIIIGAISLFFCPWQHSIAIGLTLALSSTAIVLQTLRENGMMKSAAGRSIFSVLLFQDLAVIPILAILPLLSTATKHSSSHHAFFDITTLPAAVKVFLVFASLGLIYVIGTYASRPLFRIIAATRIREIFVAAALGLVIGISLLMTLVGLSPALGAFIAGVVLANNEYRHELESDIEPFKGLLLGIFFISIGASLNFSLVGEKIWIITGLVCGLLFIKALVLFLTSISFKMQKTQRLLFSIALAQGGEFAFVLFQFAKINGVLPKSSTEILMSVVAISMFLTPLFFIFYDKVIAKRIQPEEKKREADKIEHSEHSVILAGFGRMGTNLGRILISAGIRPVFLDHDETNVGTLRKFGFEVYYGDATRLDLLQSAGIHEAKLLIITLGDHEQSIKLVKLVKKHYPKLNILVNAVDRSAAYDFMDLGVKTFRRETFGTALSLGQDALQVLGYHPYDAHKVVRLFRKKDEMNLPNLYKTHREDEESYISKYQQHNADLVELMKKDQNMDMEELDKSWTTGNPEE